MKSFMSFMPGIRGANKSKPSDVGRIENLRASSSDSLRMTRSDSSRMLEQQNGDAETRESRRRTSVACSDRSGMEFAALQFLRDIVRQTAQVRGFVAHHARGPLSTPTAIHFAGLALFCIITHYSPTVRC